MIGPHLCGGGVGQITAIRFVVHCGAMVRRCIGRDGPIVRHRIGSCWWIGPIMIGPYVVPTRHAVHRTATRVHQPFPYHHDPMHMVRHHHEFPDIHMRHVFRYRIPTPLRQFADR